MRRPAVVLLAFAAVASSYPLGVAAQRAGQIPTVGVATSSSGGPFIEAFRAGLRERGRIEGRSIRVEYRSTEGNPEGFATLIRELLGLKVDALVVVNNLAAFAAKEATTTVPVVVIAAPNSGAEPCGSDHDVRRRDRFRKIREVGVRGGG